MIPRGHGRSTVAQVGVALLAAAALFVAGVPDAHACHSWGWEPGTIGGYATVCGNTINAQLPGGSGGASLVVPGLEDVAIVAPNIPILLDTSGSMEWMANNWDYPDCNPGQPWRTNEVNRWWQVVQVLTGTIVNYSCGIDWRGLPWGRIDRCYGIRHIVAYGDGQLNDGLLDVYNGMAKFGLMTFDSWYSKKNNDDGMWSFGPNYGSYNLGARNKSAERGALISVGLETKDDMSLVNLAVQNEILCSIPYGGTPTGALIMDAKSYFRNDSDVAPPPSSGNMTGYDPFHECRDKGVILVSDGQPNTGECWLYPCAADAAADLYNNDDIKTFVVGMQINSSSAMNTLNAIALAGGTSAAHFTTDMSTFRAEMTVILDSLLAGVTSRTVPAVTNSTGPATAEQFEFSAAMQVSTGPWMGVLERTRFECSGLDLNEEFDPARDDFGARLNNQGSRTIFTYSPDLSTRSAFTSSGVPAAWLGVSTSAERDAVVDFVRGDVPERAEKKLGDIINSGPALSGSPGLDLPLEAYRAYRKYFDDLAGDTNPANDRPTMLYVGSNDGIFHAFDAGSEPSEPVELWGFVPPYALELLATQMSGHVFLVDGAPVVKDVRMSRVTLPATISDPRQTGWMTVVVSSLGLGGRAVFALDVTTPDDVSSVELLFEFADTLPDGPDADLARDVCNDVVSDRTCDSDLGLTSAKLSVATVVRAGLSGGAEEVPMVFVPGGFPPAGASATVGRSAYLVDLRNGTLVKKFDTSSRCSGETEDFDLPMTGDSAAFNDFTGSFATRFFVGDIGGRLWRFDVSSTNPDDWCQLVITPSAYINGLPIWRAPTLALDRNNNLIIIYGTGNMNQLLDDEVGNHVISLTEEITRDPTTGVITDVAGDVNWVLPLEVGEKLSGTPVVFDGCAYFATFEPEPGAASAGCKFGIGRLWGLEFTGDDASAVNDLNGCFDADGDTATFDPVLSIDLPDGSIAAGLSVVRRPTCYTTTDIPDPTNPGGGTTTTVVSGAGPASYAITAHIGSAAGTSPTGATVPKITRELAPPSASALAISWAEIFD